jgi:ferredoxin/flavodoxin---NADP+ reductase
MAADYNATVTLRVNLSPELMVLRVKLDAEPFPFEPGQYTVLGLRTSSPRLPEAPPDPPELSSWGGDTMVRRAYSITSNSKDRELEFVVTLVRSGVLTPRLFALREGGRLYVEPQAHGLFTLKTSSGNRDLLLLATGSALAPYISMLRTAFPQNPEHQYVVVHAAAVSWDLAFRAQLESLAESSKHFAYLPVISDAERDHTWHGLVGSIETLIANGEIEDQLGMPISPERFDVFLSGYPSMVDAVIPVLEERGFQTGAPASPDTTIHVERYW